MKNFTRNWVAIFLLVSSLFAVQTMAYVDMNVYSCSKPISFLDDLSNGNIENDVDFVGWLKDTPISYFGDKKCDNSSCNFSNSKVSGIAISPTSINFGYAEVGSTQSGTIRIYNNTAKVVEVNVTSSNASVRINPTAFIIESENYVDVSVAMEIMTEGINSSVITFNTSNATYSYINANLTASGFFPAIISTVPTEFSVTLKHGEVKSEQIIISNSGAGELNYNVSFDYEDMVPSPPIKMGLYAGFPSKQNTKNAKPLLSSNTKNTDIKSSTKDGVLSTFSIPGVSLATGLVWVNNLMYIVDYGSRRLFYYNPSNNTTNFIANIHSEPYGVAWDGSYLWIGNNNGTFYAYNLNGTLAGFSFQGPINNYCSIYYYGGVFYLSPLWQNGVYKIDYTGSVLWSKTLPGGITGGQIIYIPEHTSGNIWVQRETGGLIYQISNDFSSIVKSISNGFPGNCYAMTHNGTNFYSSSSSTVNIIDDGIDESVNWLSTPTSYGSVQPGTESALKFDVSSELLIVGNYKGYVVISSNDMNTPEVRVPVNLTVTGQPELSVAHSSVDFGNILVNTSASNSIVITNTGGDILSLSSFTSNIPEFSYTVSTYDIAPNEVTILNVDFLPTNQQSYTGIISFNTNDPNNPNYSIAVKGVGSLSTVNFVVKDAVTGSSISDAIVTFNGVALNQGTYSISNISAGNYSYSVSASGYTTVNSNITVNEFSEIVTVNLYEPGTEIIMFNGSVTSNCNNIFYDPGYTGNYANNQNMTLTINPPNSEAKVKVDFESFSLESGWDYLYIYDGVNTSAPHLGTFSGTSLPPTFIATNVDGALTFRFTTDGSVVRPGWKANVTCEDPNAIQPLIINVTDAISMLPVTGALVSIEGLGSGYTDLAGNYSFGTVNGGTYTYSVLLDGYFEKMGSVVYPAQTNVDVAISKWPNVFFVVKSPDGNPVPNATVKLGAYNATTDGAGHAVFSQAMPFINYSWNVSAAGYQGMAGEQFLSTDDIYLDVVIAKWPNVTFVVTSPDGNPVSNATVNLGGYSTTTDGAGYATLSQVKPFVNYSWSIAAAGYQSIGGEQFLANEDIIVNAQFVNTLPSILFNVTSNGGSPIAGAIVDLDGVVRITDGAGQVLYQPDEPFQSHSWSVSAIGYATLSGEQFAGNSPVTIDVTLQSDLVDLTLSVVDGISGNALPDAVVYFNGARYITGDYGTIVLNGFPKGNYSVSVSHHAYYSYNGTLTVNTNDASVALTKIQSVSLPYSESFNTSTPSNFSFYDVQLGNYEVVWSYKTTSHSGGVSGEMNANWRNGTSTVRMMLPPINTVDYSTINLSFRHYFDDFGTGMKVLVESSSDGSNWTPLGWEINSGSGNRGPEVVNIAITSNTSSPNTYIAFTLIGNQYYFDNWYIDDIQVTQPGEALYNTSLTIYNDVTSEPIEGAQVSLTGNGAILTNSSGIAYFTGLANGDYVYTIAKDGYVEESGIITVNNGNVTASYGVSPVNFFSVGLTVYDQSTGYPIPGALVVVEGYAASETNSEGYVSWSNVREGSYDVSVIKEGYVDHLGSVNVTDNMSTSIYLFQKYFSVYFTVLDNSSNPVPNALITLEGKPGIPTNENGQAQITGVESGNYNFIIQKSNFDIYNGVVNVSGSDSYYNATLTEQTPPTYSVLFRVTDLEGNPISNASVALSGIGTELTDVNGEVLYSNISSNESLTYEVTKVDYLVSNGIIGPLTENKEIIVALKPIFVQLFDITFNVIDVTGTALMGALVDIGSYGSATTNGAGNVTFTDIEFTDQLQYQVSLAGYQTANGATAVHGDTDATIILPLISTTTYEVTFSITNYSGKLVEKAAVYLEGYGTLYTNSNGSVVFSQVNPQNGIPYTVSYPPYDNLTGTLDVVNTNVVKNLVLNTNVYRALFTVVDQFGRPFEGISISILGNTSTVTNSNGTAVIGGLSPGNYSYMASKPNDTPVNGSFTITNADFHVDLTFSKPAYSIGLTVKDENGTPINNATVDLYGYGTKQTDEYGMVSYMNVTPANISVTVSKLGYVTLNSVLSVVDSNIEQDINLTLVRHSVQFNVLADNQPVNDAVVTFNGITNRIGNYLFENILAGTGYAYTVEKIGYVDVSGTINVSDYTAVTVTLVKEKFPVTFTVSVPSSKGINDFAAKLVIAGTTDTLDIGPNGQVVANFASGYYSFKVWASGFQDYYGSFEVNNAAASVNVTLSISTNIDNNGISNVKVYPNPFTNQVTLSNSLEIVNVVINNLIGQKVYTRKYQNSSKIIIDTNELLPGVYFVKIIDVNGNNRVIRMVKN